MVLSQPLRHVDAEEHSEARRDHLVVRVAPEILALVLVALMWPSTSGLSSSTGGPGPAFFPQVLLGLLALASLVGIALEVRRSRSGRRPAVPAPAVPLPAAPVPGDSGLASDDDAESTDIRRALLAAGLVLGYVAATAIMGWVLASTAFALVFLWLSGHRKAWSLIGVALVAPQVLAYLFVKIVYIALPTGIGLFDTVTVALYRVFGIY